MEVVYTPDQAEAVLVLQEWKIVHEVYAYWSKVKVFPDTLEGMDDARFMARDMAELGHRVQVIRQEL